jgi:small nuclear ribonucleoprotein (snRNP)-like protein
MKNKQEYSGVLVSIDKYMNLALSDAVLVTQQGTRF